MAVWEQDYINCAIEYVKEELAKVPRDGSHDWWHIERVHRLSKTLAKEEGIKDSSLLAVELAALLHDVEDWKYQQHELNAVQTFLGSLRLPNGVIEEVMAIISVIGYKDELGSHGKAVSLQASVVQDADRLDAIGAIGVARCFTFGGKFDRVLHDPGQQPRKNLTKSQYKSGQQTTTLNHFYEKLLKLKDLMKTEAGRRRAESRHTFLEQFLLEFHKEWQGEV